MAFTVVIIFSIVWTGIAVWKEGCRQQVWTWIAGTNHIADVREAAIPQQHLPGQLIFSLFFFSLHQSSWDRFLSPRDTRCTRFSPPSRQLQVGLSQWQRHALCSTARPCCNLCIVLFGSVLFVQSQEVEACTFWLCASSRAWPADGFSYFCYVEEFKSVIFFREAILCTDD